MRLHRREKIVSDARLLLSEKIVEWIRSKEAAALTDAEYLQVVAGELGDTLTGHLKLVIRNERHGDGDTPGGWEGDDPQQDCPVCFLPPDSCICSQGDAP